MNSIAKTVILSLLFGALSLASWADTDGPENGSDASSTTGSQSASMDVSTAPTSAGQLSSEPQIRQLGGAGFLTSNFGLFHWGPLHLGSAEMSQSYDGIGDRSYWTSNIRTNIIFEHQFSRNRIAFQYTPKLTIQN